MEIFGKKVRNPLESQYWTTTAYALGATAMKLSARPCGGAYASPEETSPEALRSALRASLGAGDACFELLVQPQTDPRAMPIEDATVEWKGAFVHAAKIRIPQQSFDTPEQNAFCERLVFTPWHSLEEHRPLGGINRARLVIYQAMSRMRNMMNGASSTEPTSFEIR